MKKKPKRTAKPVSTRQTKPSFATLLSEDPDLSALRAEYAGKRPKERRVAAEWAYSESIAHDLFGAAVARLPGSGLAPPRWPAGFQALAIDPEYAPALLTVGHYEYQSGRKEEGMRLLLQLTQLSPTTEDWVELIDTAGQALMDADDAAGTCRLYEAALKVCPAEKEFISGLGWALCHAGKHEEALIWMDKLLADEPDDSELLNDYGWALAEMGRFDEAQRILEKAVRLAPPGYDLPANNLGFLPQMRKRASR